MKHTGQFASQKSSGWHVAVLLAAFFLCVNCSDAATIRGLLLHQNNIPAAGIAVRVTAPGIGPSGFGYSGADGMYYLLNVPPGVYTLEVWLTNQNVLKYKITVGNEPFTDYPPIQVP